MIVKYAKYVVEIYSPEVFSFHLYYYYYLFNIITYFVVLFWFLIFVLTNAYLYSLT